MGFYSIIIALRSFQRLLDQKLFEGMACQLPFTRPCFGHDALKFVLWRASETLTPRRKVFIDSKLAQRKTIPAVGNGFRWSSTLVQMRPPKHFAELRFTPQFEFIGHIDELHVS